MVPSPQTLQKKIRKILFIPLEFMTWSNARYWSYPAGIGIEEGLGPLGISHLTIPAMFETDFYSKGSFLNAMRSYTEQFEFDMVLFTASHSHLDDFFYRWIEDAAPVRCGFVTESITLTREELQKDPAKSKDRMDKIERALHHVTHMVVVDEKDTDLLSKKGIRSFWWPASVPERFILSLENPPRSPLALFYGAVYGKRKTLLDHPRLKELIIRPRRSLEYETDLPDAFDRLNHDIHQQFSSFLKGDTKEKLSSYHLQWTRIRSACFERWMRSLQTGSAIVNLPQYGHFYSGRVYEGMAAGRPVISAEIRNRPLNQAIFTDGKDILLYDEDLPEDLAQKIQMVLSDQEFSAYLVRNSQEKIRLFHTTEKRVKDFIHWMEDGILPEYAIPHILSGNTEKKGNKGESDGYMKKNNSRTLSDLLEKKVIEKKTPLKLHLGCGEHHLNGYVNIDFPKTMHNVMNVKPDYEATITDLDFPDNSVDEIRLNHVFEHFPRVIALGLLIRWQKWLKPGGKLYIETPDAQGCARLLLSDLPWRVKTAAVRHMAGDQSAPWAYHLDHWFSERFQTTLEQLGFSNILIHTDQWPHSPYLPNVHAEALKEREMDETELLDAADRILLESTVSEKEKKTHSIWCLQLRDFLRAPSPESTESIGPETMNGKTAHKLFAQLSSPQTPLPIVEIHDFNQRSRNRWIQKKAFTAEKGSVVLDVGAGTCPYRELFSHCNYKSHDFKRYKGEKLGGTTEYGSIDYISDIVHLPVETQSVDMILCTEVLEHVPDPISALKELIRVVKPGGRLLITAPLGSGLHQLPFHYYGGFSPEWYRHFSKKFGCDVKEISPNGGFFKLMAQESARVFHFLKEHHLIESEDKAEILHLFSEKLPRFFFLLEEKLLMDQFTVGYHVELVKRSSQVDSMIEELKENPKNIELLLKISNIFLEHRSPEEALRYALSAHCLNPDHPEVKKILEQTEKEIKRIKDNHGDSDFQL